MAITVRGPSRHQPLNQGHYHAGNTGTLLLPNCNPVMILFLLVTHFYFYLRV